MTLSPALARAASTATFSVSPAAVRTVAPVAEDVAVYVEVNGAGFRLSADDAHALSELLMSASLVVERRIMEAERSRRG